jgi:hypothetical protein
MPVRHGVLFDRLLQLSQTGAVHFEEALLRA